ncbi:MAG: HEAT repeat domain-containing protein [Myxococcota bacterium]
MNSLTLAFRSLALAALLAAAPASYAASYLIYAPASVDVGGAVSEVYVPRSFDASDGLAGSALVDAAMAELGRVLGADLSALTIRLEGTSARIVIADDARRTDPKVVDRALGAAWHSLRLAGISEIRLADTLLDSTSFTRGALQPAFPLAAALPPRRLTHGYVQLGAELVTAAELQRRIAASDPTVQAAIAAQLDSAAPDVKLALLAGLRGLNLKDRPVLLIPRLTDADVRVRLASLEQLSDSRDPRVLKALEGVAQADSDAVAKAAAARVLVAAGRTEFKKYLLLEKLRADDAQTVIGAANELIATGDPKLVPAMAGLVRHANPDVRAVGVKALTQFKQLELMAEVVADGTVAKDAAQPLAITLSTQATGAARATGLGWLVSKGDRDPAITAANAVAAERVAGVVDPLAKALTRTEPEVRSAAAAALAALRDPQGLEPLAAALRGSSDEAEKKRFTDGAIAIIAAQPLDQVIKIGESPDATIRELAVKSLAEFSKDRPNPRVITVLRSRLGDSAKPIRQAAVYALARIDDPAVVKDLVALEKDPDSIVREQVAIALSRSRHADADRILLAYLDDPDNRVKLQAVIGLRERKTPAALEKLKWLVEYRQPEIRREVVRAVATLADPGDLTYFDLWQQRLYDEDAEIRLMAVAAMAQFPTDPRTAAALGGAVTDSEPRVKLRAIAALSELKDANAVEQIIRGLFDESVEVKMAALDGLEKMASPKALKALQEFISNEGDEAVRKRATEVMQKL